MKLNIGVISLFPEMFAALHSGVTGRALETGLLQLQHWNPRDYATDKHHTVDDRSYGGGPGMVMQVAPLQAAITAAKADLGTSSKVICLSPQGKRLEQQHLTALSHAENFILLCGRYEGIDERLIETAVDEQYSIGDYVLSGGELAAMVMVDAVTRLLPGALGHEQSAEQDSFMHGLLDCPHYTRPEQIAGKQVPPVLLSGDHEAVRRWRLQQALGRTWSQRPELLAGRELTTEEQQLLEEFIKNL